MKKNVEKTVLAVGMAGLLTLGGAVAYFSDGDTATNEFTVGKVSLDLQEPNWKPEDGEEIVPNQEIKKDPQIKNDGINEEYVFVEVVVPYRNIITENADGTQNAAADTELFSYDVNDGWVEVGTAKKDEEAKTVTHLYAYGSASAMTALAKDATTPTLFDAVKFCNAQEDQDLEEESFDIVVNAYGIQTTAINNGDTAIDGTTTEGKKAPEDVWAVLSATLPETAHTKGFDNGVTETTPTDIKERA